MTPRRPLALLCLAAAVLAAGCTDERAARAPAPPPVAALPAPPRQPVPAILPAFVPPVASEPAPAAPSVATPVPYSPPPAPPRPPAAAAAPPPSPVVLAVADRRPDPVAERIVREAGFTPADVGYAVYDARSGRRLAGFGEARAFLPASVAKVPTTVAALDILGPDHRFETALRATGPVRDGVLHGDLYLVGGGDPMLGAAELMSLAAALEAAGIRRVAGRFVYDESLLPALAEIEPTQNEDATYNTGVGALSADFNRRQLRWRDNRAGARLDAFTLPDLGRPAVRGPGEAGRRLRFDDGVWQIPPGAGPSGRVWVPVKDPGGQAARLFRTLAGLRGLALPPPQAGLAPGAARTVGVHAGRPVIELAESGLEFSNNLLAELLGLAAARRLGGPVAGLAESGARLAAWWRTRLPGVDWRGFALPNHSGLSSVAAITPDQLAAILAYAGGRDLGGRTYESLLPISGWKGTLDDEMRDPDLAMRVWAKTGTMAYVRSLAGWLFAHDGRPLLFALFANDAAARARYDATPIPDRGRLNAEAASWLARAKGLHEALLAHWAAAGGRPAAQVSCTAPACRAASVR